MSQVPPFKERFQTARPDKDGRPTFTWSLTDAGITDPVLLVVGPFDVLPVVFVPGIMGSNLKSKPRGDPLWRLDEGLFGLPWNLVNSIAKKGAAERQQLLHPERTEVDYGGAVPSDLVGEVSDKKMYIDRGWGSVGEGSYHSFLLWLEKTLNPRNRNPVYWKEYYQDEETISSPLKPGERPKMFTGVRMGMKGQPFGAEGSSFKNIISDDLIAQSKFIFPVHAVGYNWLASNSEAAAELAARIDVIIAQNNKGYYRCSQVILITHSMGGLVGRACAKRSGMSEKIAGIVHGVMPAVGAAVAYRRCKVGMRDEDFGAGLVIGSTGQEVTAVFAQAPGALQLLPSQLYNPNWLQIESATGSVEQSLPLSSENDPYKNIYLRRDVWWGLINEEWLSPKGGVSITWEQFSKNIESAKNFHAHLADFYHPCTYVYYGADEKFKSFEKLTWKMVAGIRPDSTPPPTIQKVLSLRSNQVRVNGGSVDYVGGKTEYQTAITPNGGGYTSSYETSYWELHCEMQDGIGDGTVPASSGAMPLRRGGANILQQFRLKGFGHEKSYQNATAQSATLFAIAKIAGQARRVK